MVARTHHVPRPAIGPPPRARPGRRPQPSPPSWGDGERHPTLRVAVLCLDLVIALTAAAALVILVTGGGATTVLGVAVSATHARNPLVALFVLAPLRCFLAPAQPFLLVPRLHRGFWDASSEAWASRLAAFCRRCDTRVLSRPVLALLVASAAVKLVLAVAYFGFAHGDAVEIQHFTFDLLGRGAFPLWEVRSPVYPALFVYPAQAVAAGLGWSDPRELIVAGRIPVILFSLVNLLLVRGIAHRLIGHPGAGTLALLLLAVSGLHVRLGSTELPRTVATSFLLAAFALVLQAGPGRAVAAGLLAGIGGTLRLGEVVFWPALLAQLALERRFRDALYAGLGLLFGALLVLGPGDLLYWPHPFFTLANMIDYAVVQRLSSSGYEPWYAYARIGLTEVSPVTTALVVYALVRRRVPVRLGLWIVVPLVLLSGFQHKEARYLLPLLPFAILAVTAVLAPLLASPAPAWRRHVLVYLLAGIVLFELDRWRREGSEPVIAAATALAARPATKALLIEGGDTTTGADLYLEPRVEVVGFEPADWPRLGRLAGEVRAPHLLVSQRTYARPGVAAALAEGGYRILRTTEGRRSSGTVILELPSASTPATHGR